MNYASMSNEELVSLFRSARNGYVSVMAATELANRLDRGEYVMVDADEYEQLKETAEAANN